MDEQTLVDAIRDRVADPERRLDHRPSEFLASVKSMSLGELFSSGRTVAGQLSQLMAGGVTDELTAEAERYQEAMNRPLDRPLPERASADALDAAEASMSVTLPPFLRRLYTEIANGGFGPGAGLIGVRGGWTDDDGRTMEQLHEMLAEGDPDEPSWDWPVGLVPVVDESPAWICLDTASPVARVVRFDMEGVDYAGWDASFTDVAPSLVEWLSTWVRSRPAHEVLQDEMAAAFSPESQVAEARRARAMIGAMSLEERRAMGLPDEGWEQVVWGGIGLEDDD